MFKLCWHKWSKWGRPFEFGRTAFQKRVCFKCQKVQQRKAGWPISEYNEYEESAYYEYDFDREY